MLVDLLCYAAPPRLLLPLLMATLFWAGVHVLNRTFRPYCSGTGVDAHLEFRDTAEPLATIRREGRKKGVSGNAAETLFRSLAVSPFDALTPVLSIKTIRRQTGEMQALALLIVQLEVERSM